MGGIWRGKKKGEGAPDAKNDKTAAWKWGTGLQSGGYCRGGGLWQSSYKIQTFAMKNLDLAQPVNGSQLMDHLESLMTQPLPSEFDSLWDGA